MVKASYTKGTCLRVVIEEGRIDDMRRRITQLRLMFILFARLLAADSFSVYLVCSRRVCLVICKDSLDDHV